MKKIIFLTAASLLLAACTATPSKDTENTQASETKTAVVDQTFPDLPSPPSPPSVPSMPSPPDIDSTEATPEETDGSGSDETIACTMDARECADGSYVGRVAPDCGFAPCPDGSQPKEPSEPFEPPTDPSISSNDDAPIPCPADAKVCPDGSSVSRQGPNCEFAPCPPDTPPSL